MSIYQIALTIVSFVLLLATFLPLIKKEYWAFRVFDYPRMQKLALIVLALIGWYFSYIQPDHYFPISICALLLIGLVYLITVVWPFTPLSKTMIDRVKGSDHKSLNLLVCNVYQDNEKYARLLELIEKNNPDIVFLLETDELWKQGVSALTTNYPYSIQIPKDNTYGMLFFSRLPLHNSQTRYLIDPEIPSIATEIDFEGQRIQIFGLHPTPPVPQENKTSTDRDAEILLIGKEVKGHSGPCLVIGDLNDVAWSYTTNLFLKLSGMLDPRRGRGIYSTFNANHLLLRWPLDHIFVSTHFRLSHMKVERHVGSDHFPISIGLVLSAPDNEEQLEADAKDKKVAEKKISSAKGNV